MKSNSKSIKQKPTAKLLGITFDCSLTWNEQINIITKSTYGVLRVLKSCKRFAALQRGNASLNHMFYNKLIIAILFMAKCLIILLNDYRKFRTVLQHMFLAVMPMLITSLI